MPRGLLCQGLLCQFYHLYLVPQLSALVSFRTLGTWEEGHVFPDLPLTQEEWETCITLTDDALPYSWLHEFTKQPYKMYRADYPVTIHMNAAISFILNRFLFPLHPNPL